MIVGFLPPQELEQQFERERLALEEQKTLLLQQLEELRQELSSKLAAANEEVKLPFNLPQLHVLDPVGSTVRWVAASSRSLKARRSDGRS